MTISGSVDRDETMTLVQADDGSRPSPPSPAELPAFPLCARFQIDRNEIQARRAFLGFTLEDEENLEGIHDLIAADVDAIIAEFYAHLTQVQELGRFLSDPEVLDRLQKTQRQYLLTLGRNADQLAYFEGRLRIGMAHERVELPQRWYLGAYVQLFNSIDRRLTSRYAGESAKLAGMLATLHKIFTLDSILAVETYYQSTVQQLEIILHQFAQAQHTLEELSRLDGLTRINNRTSLMEGLARVFGQSVRFHRPFTVLFVDIDRFKEVNDRHGHALGDFVLKKMVETIGSVLRPADIIGRYGGDEFLAGLVETDVETARQIAERMRLKIARTPFVAEGHTVSLTISVGLAPATGDTERVDELIERADRALYQAKQAGRNRVCVATGSTALSSVVSDH